MGYLGTMRARLAGAATVAVLALVQQPAYAGNDSIIGPSGSSFVMTISAAGAGAVALVGTTVSDPQSHWRYVSLGAGGMALGHAVPMFVAAFETGGAERSLILGAAAAAAIVGALNLFIGAHATRRIKRLRGRSVGGSTLALNF